MDAPHGELKTGLGGAGHRLLLVARRAADDALGALQNANVRKTYTQCTRATRAFPESPFAPLPDMLKEKVSMCVWKEKSEVVKKLKGKEDRGECQFGCQLSKSTLKHST